MIKMIGTYQLREAAGFYWLINMEQSGKDWERPMRLNETGVLIVTQLAQGASRAQIAEKLAEEYGMTTAELRQDVDAFCAQLESFGMCVAAMKDGVSSADKSSR